MNARNSLKKIKNSEKAEISKAIQKFVPEETLKAIGLVITQWSALEEVISCAIWQAARVEGKTGRVITSQLGMMAKVDLLSALLHRNFPFFASQFDKTSNYITGNLNGRRNFVAHGHWVLGGKGWALVNKFTSRGKPADKSVIMGVSDLEKLAQEIAETTFWIMTLAAALPSLKNKPTSQDQERLDRLRGLLASPTQSTLPPPPLKRRPSTRKKK